MDPQSHILPTYRSLRAEDPTLPEMVQAMVSENPTVLGCHHVILAGPFGPPGAKVKLLQFGLSPEALKMPEVDLKVFLRDLILEAANKTSEGWREVRGAGPEGAS